MKNEKKKILVIEDDPVLLKNIKEILEEEDFLVKAESGGASGIKTAYQWYPDLILCDIEMPIKNGYDVLQEILKCDKLKSTPFIFLTAKIEKEDIRKGMQLGADDYIFKPFALDDLINSIRLRLEKSNYRSQGDFIKNKVYEMDDKIILKNGSKLQLYLIRDLKFIRSKNPYVLLKFMDGKNTLQRQTLDEWESKLPTKYFIRIHRSTIINTEFISKIEKLSKTSYLMRLKEEEEPFVISKRYITKIKNHFS